MEISVNGKWMDGNVGLAAPAGVAEGGLISVKC